jgi:hypothetical protein
MHRQQPQSAMHAFSQRTYGVALLPVRWLTPWARSLPSCWSFSSSSAPRVSTMVRKPVRIPTRELSSNRNEVTAGSPEAVVPPKAASSRSRSRSFGGRAPQRRCTLGSELLSAVVEIDRRPGARQGERDGVTSL